MSNVRVLAVDDERVTRRAVGASLAKHGHRVIEAASGGEGVRLAIDERPPFIVLDVVMPELDGFECAGSCAGRGTARRF